MPFIGGFRYLCGVDSKCLIKKQLFLPFQVTSESDDESTSSKHCVSRLDRGHGTVVAECLDAKSLQELHFLFHAIITHAKCTGSVQIGTQPVARHVSSPWQRAFPGANRVPSPFCLQQKQHRGRLVQALRCEAVSLRPSGHRQSHQSLCGGTEKSSQVGPQDCSPVSVLSQRPHPLPRPNPSHQTVATP